MFVYPNYQKYSPGTIYIYDSIQRITAPFSLQVIIKSTAFFELKFLSNAIQLMQSRIHNLLISQY